MPSKREGYHNIATRVKDEEKARIDEFCKENDMSVSQLIRKAIKEYIARQLKVDKESDQLSLFDPRDPFTGSK